MVEQKLKNVQLDVRKKRSLAEARVRNQRMEEERRAVEKNGSISSSRGGGVDFTGGGGDGAMGGGDLSEEGMRWQMQIQEDVSIIIFVYLLCA